MKAVVLHEYGGPSKLKYEEMPDPVAGEAKARFPVEFPGVLGMSRGRCERWERV